MIQLHVLRAEHDVHEMQGDPTVQTAYAAPTCSCSTAREMSSTISFIGATLLRARSQPASNLGVQAYNLARESSTSERIWVIRSCYVEERQNTPLTPPAPLIRLQRSVYDTVKGQSDRIWSSDSFARVLVSFMLMQAGKGTVLQHGEPRQMRIACWQHWQAA